VVHDQQQHVVERAEAKQGGAEERPLLEVEGTLGLLGDETARFPVPLGRPDPLQVHDRQTVPAVRPHDLERAPFGDREVVRRLACRSTIVARLRRSASRCSAPSSRNAWTTL